jgi:hypothetical protein
LCGYCYIIYRKGIEEFPSNVLIISTRQKARAPERKKMVENRNFEEGSGLE